MSHHYAFLYLRPGGEYIVSSASQRSGFWVTDDDPTLLLADATPSAIGDALVAGLHSSRDEAPDVDLNAVGVGPVVELAGEASIGDFMKGTKEVEVFADFDDTITEVEITPLANGGLREGYTPFVKLRSTLPFTTSEALGVAALNALNDATS